MAEFANIDVKVPVWLDKICAWPVLVYRKHKYGCSFRKISLGEDKFTIVDQQDFYRFSKFQWFEKQNRQCFYAVRSVSISTGRLKIFSLHREIMSPPAGLVVDHRNGIGLDNRRDNLRWATKSQNSCNKRKTSSKTSSCFVGVCFHKKRNYWAAGIRVNGKLIWLGSFDNEIDAAKAYDEAAKKYYGQFARLNFPTDAVDRRIERLFANL